MTFNLDTAVKEADDKSAEPFKFRYKRKSWTLQTAGSLDIRILLDPATENITTLEQFKILLGDDQWDDFPDITVSATEILMEAYSEHIAEEEGASLGESEPPTDS